ncbi:MULTISPECIES: LysR family transcriptional regulator [Pseudomonas]|uniref:LysR family transcriptional regulator n=1 Tax=Pseudomonas TaxID=286 RepID=UPI0002A43783|nr:MULTISPECIES: LysR family transcriptional regulator [Pseudomonas]MBB1608825.1 LysR family transcriptional regulator [Pseudomonas sp. UMC76]MBB1637654.1 LysR family transcriptional regulator [Pseudomonas sp. UME83]NTX91841.1 LysR family transcriptional regulator [Pseudomonas sp. UMA643]NTY20814.1 LysR family transcriptional regulator [Pseudomonas sp. UMC3103]NTY25797.1 LysR family transcriptional regulator [Pseudomonas sp. UMA603]
MLHSNYLKQLDLQDIVVFLNLLEQRSAKRTAELMNVSQPTVSYCLKRLRSCFDDALFASSQGGLKPTTKAEKIAPYLRMVVESVNRCAEGIGEALPLTERKIWKLCAPEYFELLFLSQALAVLSSAHASNTSLHLERLSRDLPVDRLISGDIDIAIGFGPGYHQMHPELQWQPVLNDEFVCLTSQASLTSEEAMSLDEFCASPQVFPTPWISEKNMVDSWLEKVGRSRNVLVRANGYQACVNIVAAVPSTVAMPARLLPYLRIPQELKVCQPPMGFPSFTLDMVWARSRGQSKDISSLRKLVHDVAGGMLIER